MEQEEVSEQVSDVDESFLDEPEVLTEEFTVGDSTVVFQEEAPMSATEGAKIGSDFWDPDQEWVATSIGKTESGNEVQVIKRTGGSGYELRLKDGGHLPAIYTGWYTSYDKARDAATEFLNDAKTERS